MKSNKFSSKMKSKKGGFKEILYEVLCIGIVLVLVTVAVYPSITSTYDRGEANEANVTNMDSAIDNAGKGKGWVSKPKWESAD